ncbi:hypothetical protein GcM1_224035 [Golovinomyces cichoracearum]|uniref:Uncharacterized protein n=1 Tax=Golovinomyces cichoracearum TaxID=62708 RepID=A0A420IQM5_9PEZI|nr:hypothetical protein GcM1_224035 [Golovinomyces cichoracearum]
MARLPSLGRRWKWPRIFISLTILELAGTIIALALFSIAQPDLFRTKLWQVGNYFGFNSSPAQILYAYANHRPIPRIPFVWSETEMKVANPARHRLTDLNVAVSVLSLFLLLVKVVMFVLKIWFPILGTISSASICALWITSMYGQMGPDYIDHNHPSHIAWYIGHSCDIARQSGNHHYCVLAKVTFANTVFMSAIFFLNTTLGIHSLLPSSQIRPTAAGEPATSLTLPFEWNRDGNDSRCEWEMISLSPGHEISSTQRSLYLNKSDIKSPPLAVTGKDRSSFSLAALR